MKFIDLFAGLGGFHKALVELGHECVFASEVDEELRNLYSSNFPDMKCRTFGDIRLARQKIPRHDILCAGFPCQPFSKSGYQKGLEDQELGTLFDEIVRVLARHKPQYIILENVGNFERHDKGRTWRIVKQKLIALGYDIKGTEHISSGGSGLISPHHFGYPHTRERFFIVGKLGKLPERPLPTINRYLSTTLNDIVQPKHELSENDLYETALTAQQLDCINLWNSLLSKMPANRVTLPSFPIWGDELDASYPFEIQTPYATPLKSLKLSLNGHFSDVLVARNEILALLPSYARTKQKKFPSWKVTFIRQNREWFARHREYFTTDWISKLHSFPASLRKLEWNCQGEERDIWKHILQFRPSGLRVKRFTTSPALVAMTTTQIPILGPQKRFLSQIEGLRLQGFPDSFRLPSSREKSFRALGNAVHVGVVKEVARCLLTT
ncbi:MAG: DNA cytosine methyltransferase [Anaerolineae bacterium]|nr:DNA cytosine methyltransferase [Anaerolineae bacterium]